MLLYGVAFLAFILVLLPWLAHRLDVYRPDWRIELGPARWLGVGLFAACFVVYVASSYILTRRGRGAYVEFDPPRAFVATGPFRWSRNPIAGSVVGMLLGEALAFSSTGIFLLFLLSVPLAHAQVVLLEEPLLRRRFGAAYEAYLARVPRWLPRRPTDAAPNQNAQRQQASAQMHPEDQNAQRQQASPRQRAVDQQRQQASPRQQADPPGPPDRGP